MLARNGLEGVWHTLSEIIGSISTKSILKLFFVGE